MCPKRSERMRVKRRADEAHGPRSRSRVLGDEDFLTNFYIFRARTARKILYSKKEPDPFPMLKFSTLSRAQRASANMRLTHDSILEWSWPRVKRLSTSHDSQLS